MALNRIHSLSSLHVRLEQCILAQQAELAKATFAGGCFWCMEPPFDKIPGVVSTTSGYTGGRIENPSYKQVSSGGTGHIESLQILYDPEKVSYGELLDVFWRNVDPTDPAGQFCDRGSQYQTAIFYHTDEQRELAVRVEARARWVRHDYPKPSSPQFERRLGSIRPKSTTRTTTKRIRCDTSFTAEDAVGTVYWKSFGARPTGKANQKGVGLVPLAPVGLCTHSVKYFYP